jgi:hypothetical protein
LDAHASGDRGANGSGIKYGAFDGARFDYFCGKILQRGLGSETKPKPFHSTKQTPLAVPDSQERRHQFGIIPCEMRPFRLLVDIPHEQIYPHGMR